MTTKPVVTRETIQLSCDWDFFFGSVEAEVFDHLFAVHRNSYHPRKFAVSHVPTGATISPASFGMTKRQARAAARALLANPKLWKFSTRRQFARRKQRLLWLVTEAADAAGIRAQWEQVRP